MNRRIGGFTLLELLIALAIFAILSALAYGGLNSVLKARHETDRQAARLREVQSAVLMLSRDLAQAAPREIRGEYGDMQPAMRGGVGSSLPLEFTRAGWRNPAAQQRSSMQRVAWTVDEGVLVRQGWRVLDRAQDSMPLLTPALTGVRDFKVRFLNADRQWLDDWPPLVQTPVGQPVVVPVPLAVELTLELEDLGVITRLLRVPGA